MAGERNRLLEQQQVLMIKEAKGMAASSQDPCFFASLSIGVQAGRQGGRAGTGVLRMTGLSVCPV
jgi:hypothetical protein